MKYKMLALILMLTVVSWTQTATQPAPSTDPSSTTTDKAKCACCEKMAKSDSKDAHAACMEKHAGKEMASCCTGKQDKESCCSKDGASCMKDGKMAESCCKGKDAMKCDPKSSKDCGKGCCGSNKSEKTA